MTHHPSHETPHTHTRTNSVSAEIQRAQDVIRRELIPPFITMIKDLNGSNRGARSITFQQHVGIHNLFVRHRRVVDQSDWRAASSQSQPVRDFERVHVHLVTTCTRLVQELVGQPNVRVARLLLIPCLYTCGSWEVPHGILRRPMLDDPARILAMAAAMRWILESFHMKVWEPQDLDAADLLRVLVVCGGLVLQALSELQQVLLADKLDELRGSSFLELVFCVMGKLLPVLRTTPPPVSSYVPTTYTSYQKFFLAIDRCLTLHITCAGSGGVLTPSLSNLCEQLVCLDRRREYASSAQQIDEVTTLLWACRRAFTVAPPPTDVLELLRRLPDCVQHASNGTRFHLTRLVWDTARHASQRQRVVTASSLLRLVCLFGKQQQERPWDQRYDADEMLSLVGMTIGTGHRALFASVPRGGHIAAAEALVRTVGRAVPGVEIVLRLLLLCPCSAETLSASVSIAITAHKLVRGMEPRYQPGIRSLCLDLLFQLQGRPQTVARSGLQLATVVASILAGVCVHADTEELEDVVRTIALLGPMAGIRTAISAILVCGHHCPCVRGYLWRAAFPHTLPATVCSSWTCSNITGHSEMSVPTKLCGGCRSARYCSLECQTASWKYGHAFDCDC